MLEIILTTLKFAGIGIGILLAVILLLLLLVLLVPFRYDATGENKEKMQAKGKIHWLFNILSFQICYENDEMKMVARVFGVPVWKK